MFNKFLIVFLLFTLLGACKKDNPEPKVIVTNNTYRVSGVSPAPGITYSNVTIAPNPVASNESVMIGFQNADTSGLCSIKVLAGKYSETVYSQQLTAKINYGSVELSLQNFPTGVVLIQVLLNTKLWEYNLIIQ